MLKTILQHSTAIALASSFITPIAYAKYDDYLSANGLKIELGQSQRYLESKLGTPESEYEQYHTWTLKNGNSLSASFDEYGLNDATISGDKPDFLMSSGVKITIGQDSLNSAQKNIVMAAIIKIGAKATLVNM